MERVENIQNQAAFAITGTWQGTSRNKLYDEYGLNFVISVGCIVFANLKKGKILRLTL